MSEHVFWPLVTAFLTVFFVWLLVSGFRRGEMELSFPVMTLSGRRKDQPVRFWAVAGCVTFFVIVLLLGTLGLILFPNHF